MKKTYTLFTILLLLAFGFLTLNAGTSRRLVSAVNPDKPGEAEFYVVQEKGLIAQLVQTVQTQTAVGPGFSDAAVLALRGTKKGIATKIDCNARAVFSDPYNGGVAAVYAALRPGGILAVWSAWEDRGFEQRLRHHGFMVEVERVRARSQKGGARHTIFLGSKHARERDGFAASEC